MKRIARFSRHVFILIAIALAAVTLTAQQADAGGPWYVTPDGNDANSCLSPIAPCATINGALAKAAAGDTINVAEGVYPSDCTLTPCEAVIVDKDIHLSGGWDSSFVTQDGMSIIDGERTRRGLFLRQGRHAVIDRFEVQHGGAAAIYNYSGYLTLNECIIRDNGSQAYGSYGGGLYSFEGSSTLNHCVISGNSAVVGGGIVADARSKVVISNSAITSNYASESGGGLAAWRNGAITLNNTTVGANVAERFYGGGIYASEGGEVTLNNSTVNANINNGKGGGGIFNSGAPVVARNTIIANNRAVAAGNDCAGAMTSSGHNLIGDTEQCDYVSGPGDILNTDARLIPLARQLGLVLLQADSPAVDGGNPAGCADQTGAPLVTDQRGATRDDRCDIGAYEYTPTAGAPTALYAAEDATPQSANAFAAFPTPLRAVALDDQYSQVIDPVEVTFTAPEDGPSGIFKSTGARTITVTTDKSGVAAAEFGANELSGTYSVTATLKDTASRTEFELTNLAWQPAGSFVKTLSPLGEHDWLDNNWIRLTASPDATDGKNIFASYIGHTERDHFLWTNDGGLTWNTVKLPSPASSTEIAVAPQFASNRTLYLLADGKLYKSTDAGAHWEPLLSPSNQHPNLIRLSPNYAVDHAVFVGLYVPYTERGGVYRTTDDGQTWTRLTTGNIGDAITDLDISPGYPADPTMYLVNYNDGIFRSDDAGMSWKHLSDPQFSPDFRVALSPDFPQDHTIFVAANGITNGGAYRSTNRGDAWTRVKDGNGTQVLAVSPRYADDHTVIIGGNFGDLFMTEDSGDTWLPLRGFECYGIYGHRCDALITYQNDRLQPIAGTYQTIYRYQWPSIDARAFVPLEPGQTAPLTHQFSIDPGNAAGASWTAAVTANWLTATPLTGTLPITLTLTINPAEMTSELMRTEMDMTVHWSRYQTENVRIPVTAMVVHHRVWLPVGYRP